jgi:CBS domain-containing protein
MDDVVRFFSESPPWRELSAARIAALARTVQIEYCPRGLAIIEAGSGPMTHLVVIRSGSVEARDPALPECALVDRLAEGDAFDTRSIVENRPPEQTYIALEDTLVYRIPADVLLRLLEEPSLRIGLAGRPGERISRALEDAPRRPSIEVLGRTVGDLVTRPPLGCSPDTTVRDAARRMRESGVAALLIESDPPGIVTDRDFRNRVLAEGLDPMTPVSRVCTVPMVTVPAESLLVEALAVMLEHGVRHLPVVRTGRVIGVVTVTDIVRVQSRNPLLLRRVLDRARGLEDFSAWSDQVRHSLEGLVLDDARASVVFRVASLSGDTLLRRILDDAVSRLAPEPGPWVWLAWGAAGRRESGWPPRPAGILAFADDVSDEDAGWFQAFRDEVATAAASAGLPAAPAAPAVLVERISTLVKLSGEAAAADPARLCTWLDARPVAGTLDPTRWIDATFQAAYDRQLLARIMLCDDRPPPRGFFRGCVLECTGQCDDTLDLVKRAEGPLADLARVASVLSFHAGLNDLARRAVDTPARLREADETGVLESTMARGLAAAWEWTAGLRLRLGSLDELDAGRPVSSTTLSTGERRLLKDVFAQLAEGRRALRRHVELAPGRD